MMEGGCQVYIFFKWPTANEKCQNDFLNPPAYKKNNK